MTGRRAFTLVELLVVIAIISVLAAILFPVFAKAREKARQTQCLSNVRQLGTAAMTYVSDYGEEYPLGCGVDVWGRGYYLYYARVPVQATNPEDGSQVMNSLQPYIGGTQIYACPSQPRWQVDSGVLVGYGFNGLLSARDDETVQSPSKCFMWCENGRNHTGAALSNAVPVTYPSGGTTKGTAFQTWRASGAATARMEYWGDVTDPPRATTHNGGQNYCYCDGHAKWIAEPSVNGTWERLKPDGTWENDGFRIITYGTGGYCPYRYCPDVEL